MPVGPPKIIIYHANQCDPKKCTGLRVVRQGRAVIIRDFQRIPHGGVVLNPVSRIALSPADREDIARHGLIALDCSWKRAEAIFRSSRSGKQRALPYLLAANPTNTYKPVKLSTAEALAAALYITGFREQAEDMMSVFKWGPTFLTLNEAWLDAYSQCASSTEVVAVQSDIMASHTRKV